MQQSNGRVDRVANDRIDRHHRSADDAVAHVDALHTKQRGVRGGVQVGEHPLVRIGRSRQVGAEGQKEDRRVGWQAGTAAEEIRERQIVGPGEGGPSIKATKLVLELATPDEELDRSELRSDLDRALATLPGSLREAFVMKHVEGRSYEEMADLLGTTVGALKMRVHRAREALQALLEEKYA